MKRLPREIYDFLRQIKYFFLRCLMACFWIFPIDSSKIVFCNFHGKGFGDNPKYIALALHEKNVGNMYWLCDKDDPNMPEYITVLRYRSIKALFHLATAKVWIDNARKEADIIKRKGQFYVQTWHGSIALKKIEKDAEETLNPFYLSYAKRDAKYTDLMLSNSAFADKMFANSFWYGGGIFRSGSPRLDMLFLENEGRIRDLLGISKDDYVVLYAPTFRSNWSIEPYSFDRKEVKEAFEKLTNRNVVILYRLHPNLLKVVNLKLEESFVSDVSSYPDVYELMNEADALITDYSSLMFEFPISSSKPVFLYATDVAEYDRGFYFQLEDLPYPFAENQRELVDNIAQFSQDIYDRELKKFYEKIELFEDGKASQRVAEKIMEVMR